MNTGFLGPAVATVLTVYGIETVPIETMVHGYTEMMLQQYLPFTVLKPSKYQYAISSGNACCNSTYRLRY